MKLPALPKSAQAKGGKGGMVLPNGTDLRQVMVLSKDDWQRIQYQLNKRNIEAERQKKAQEERDRMHELSKERVKNWTNTVVVSDTIGDILNPFAENFPKIQ